MKVTTRFAPSPTGSLHLGGARTALFNWLFAKNKGGEFLLRFEDTDIERSNISYCEQIEEALQWLGIDYPKPTFQTQKISRYKDIAENLLKNGYAYYCNCSQERLQSIRTQQIAQGTLPKYDGQCRNKSILDEGSVIRIKLPSEQHSLSFNDTIRGELTILQEQLDDFIILRSNGIPTFNFAVIIDDNDQEISHVIRGDDHITNTFKQKAISQLAKLNWPSFTHVPLLLDQQGKVLSKRDAASNVLQYRENGFTSEALNNYLLRLGWSKNNLEYITMKEAIRHFSLSGLNRSACKIDIDKLSWLNKQHIKNIPPKEIAMRLIHHKEETIEWLASVITLYQGRVETLKELEEIIQSFLYPQLLFNEDELLFCKDNNTLLINLIKQINNLVDWNKQCLKDILTTYFEQFDTNLSSKFFPILRIFLIGRSHGPSLESIMEILGKVKTIKRLELMGEYS
ncbi:MAG: glutamate--tRNA ligase [Methylacidiphilales bacterium]|nr:glutamate--tRNA ligase [Candidatus Methylacidiphilales bacterium]